MCIINNDNNDIKSLILLNVSTQWNLSAADMPQDRHLYMAKNFARNTRNPFPYNTELQTSLYRRQYTVV